jgi:hypothetical protein
MNHYTARSHAFRTYNIELPKLSSWAKKGLKGALLAISAVLSIGWMPFLFWCICH